MRKLTVSFVALIFAFFTFTGCVSSTYQNGTYRAEVVDYDSLGYKDYLVVEIQEGAVIRIEFDAVDAQGQLRSADEGYREEMEAQQSTYPARYAADLIIQYMEVQDISKVDSVAGATYSSQTFTTLFTALQENMLAGDTATVVVNPNASRSH